MHPLTKLVMLAVNPPLKQRPIDLEELRLAWACPKCQGDVVYEHRTGRAACLSCRHSRGLKEWAEYLQRDQEENYRQLFERDMMGNDKTKFRARRVRGVWRG